MPKLLIFDAFTHFCGVKLLASKSGCVKFLTNSMSDAAFKRDFCQPSLGNLLRLGLAQSGQQSNNLVPFVILCLVSFAPALVFASFGTISQILCLLLVVLLLLDIYLRHNEFRKTSQKKNTPYFEYCPNWREGKGGGACLN